MSMISSLFVLLKLLLGSLKLRTSWIIMFVARDGLLNGNFLLSGVAIYFRKPLGNLGRTWQTLPLFWHHIWSIEGYGHSQGGGNVSFWFYFVDCVLVYRYAYVFVQLCLDVYVVHVVLLHVRHDSWCAISSTHRVATQHTLGPPVLWMMWLQYIK